MYTNIERESSVAYNLCKKGNGYILKNTIIDKLQDLFKLMIDSVTIDNHQVSINNLYVTDDLAFLVILQGKDFSSSKWCFKCKLHPKVLLKRGHKINEDWITNALRLVSESDFTGSARLGVNKVSIWEFIEVGKYMCPIRNQIYLVNNVLYNLLDYRNEFIENITSKEQVARNCV